MIKKEDYVEIQKMEGDGWNYGDEIAKQGCYLSRKIFLRKFYPKEWKKYMNSKYENTDMKMQPKKPEKSDSIFQSAFDSRTSRMCAYFNLGI